MTNPRKKSVPTRARTLLAQTSRGDRWAIAALAVLPLLAFALPTLLGRNVLLGDDFTQNYPLRAFVGSQIRHGHLPLLNSYIWSGAPLLGGWNAGAAYPFTALFIILPATAAWAINLIATWWVAGLGSFAFLRASRLGSVASFVGALSFSFAGAMTAQIVHFGLVAGVSWIPVVLLALLRISQSSQPSEQSRDGGQPQQRRPSRLLWVAVLGIGTAMVILAGEPRAITTAAVIVVIFWLWRLVRLGRSAGTFLALTVLGFLLAAALGAIQWLPGIEAVRT